MTILLWIAAIPICLLVGGALWTLWLGRGFPNEREKEAGTFADHFVYVNENGTARELSADERSYLNTKFYPTDGNRPYIKDSYRQRTPVGDISGYLLKKRLPRRVHVGE